MRQTDRQKRQIEREERDTVKVIQRQEHDCKSPQKGDTEECTPIVAIDFESRRINYI